MSSIAITVNNLTNTIDLQDIQSKSYLKQVKLFNEIDNILLDINKNKHNTAKEIIHYVKSIRSPQQIDLSKVTLLTLMDFFQKTYVNKTFKVKLREIPKDILKKSGYSELNIISKINNFPHLIGVGALRDNSGKVISRAIPRNFLDGILYQWVLLNNHDDFKMDLEKLEVFPWIHQTLSNPTYILTNNAINTTGTKLHADLIFIRAIFNSDNYSFHIVALKNEEKNIFAFKSQFAIRKDRYYRIKKMFYLEKAIYDFYKEKRKVPR